eukprot:Skav214279  [mRNA]  locus=scaffold642:572555:573499:- [translate_table: standard]
MLRRHREDHLSLSLVASFLTLLPVGFVAFCAWIVLKELPKRLHRMDAKFLRSFSFLISRFSPGKQAFSIFFLVRNAVVAAAPILPSADAACFLIFAMLSANLCLTGMFQPWLSALANYTDMLANFVFLTIILSGAFFVEASDGLWGMIFCSALVSMVLVLFAGLFVYTLVEHFIRKQSKDYHFFLTHHKRACGSLARMMKVELQQRGFTVFLDTDDLSSLVNLFSTLSQNVDTVLVLASPHILHRKWCVGEIVTANIQKVETVVLALPNFHFPDDRFIDAFDSVVGELKDLAAFGLGRSDVKEGLRTLAVRGET